MAFRGLVLTWHIRTLRWRESGRRDVYIPAHPMLISKLTKVATRMTGSGPDGQPDPKADPLRTVLLTRAQVDNDPMVALATIKAVRACIRGMPRPSGRT